MAEGTGKAKKYKFNPVPKDQDLRERNGKYYVFLGGKNYVSLKTTNINEARIRKLAVKRETFSASGLQKSTIQHEISIMLENAENHRSSQTYTRWEIICRLYLGTYCRKYGITPDDWNNSQWLHYVSQVRLFKPDKIFFNHRKVWSKLAHQMFDRNVIARIPKFSEVDEKTYKERGFNAEQVRNILAVAKRDLKLQMLLAIHTPRLREILHLKWAQVNLKEGFLEFEDSKTKGRRRYIPLNEQTVCLLKAQKISIKESLFVFPSPIDNTKPANDNKRAWRTALKKAGITWIPRCTRFQDLRGFAITQMLNQHGDVYQVAKIAGNSPEIIKKHYEKLERMQLKRFAPDTQILDQKGPTDDDK